MKKESNSPKVRDTLERLPDYLSVREAAKMLGVSERSIYSYVASGKLPGARIGNVIVVRQDGIGRIERRSPGRLRSLTPHWRIPPARNSEFLTTITVRVLPGQGEALADRLAEMRRENRHCFPGTAARYITCSPCGPDEVKILLFWRGAIRPPAEERDAALATLAADMINVLDWETANIHESRVLLHAQ